MAPSEQAEPRAKRARFAEEEQEPDLFGEEHDSYQEYIPLKKRRQIEEHELSKRSGM
ncbi:hypothetical protein WJX84_006200, partial [Apatococcus fuscideae]